MRQGNNMFGVNDAIAAGLKIVDKFVPDPAEKIKAEAALRESLLSWDAQQNTINAAEAANTNVWVSGARPFIIWGCGAALVSDNIIRPFAIALGMHDWPQLNSEGLNTILLGVLGMGGLRTYEKVKGVASK